MNHEQIAESCRHWAAQMHRAASAVEAESDGSMQVAAVIDGNRAVAETLAQAAEAVAKLARIAAILEPLRALEAAAEPAPWHHFHNEGHSCDCGQIWSNDDLLFLPHESEGSETNEERAADRAMRKPSGKLAVAARNALPALLREIQEGS